MKHERRVPYLREQMPDVQIGHGFEVARGAFRRSGLTLDVIESIHRFFGGARHELRGKKITCNRVIRAPNVPDKGQHRLNSLTPTFVLCAFQTSSREAAVQDQTCHSFRISDCVGNGDRTPLRHSEKGKAIKSRCLHNPVEIGNPRFERDVLNIPLGKPITPCIISEKLKVSRQTREDLTEKGCLPIVLEMIEPIRSLNQLGSDPRSRVGQSYAIIRRAIPYLLPDVIGSEAAPLGNRIRAHRPGNVLQRLFPEIDKSSIYLAFQAFPNSGGDTDAALG